MNKLEMTQEAYQRAFAACREYDSRWVVPEIKRNNLWLKAFHNSETLPNMVKDILSSANLEKNTGCWVFGVSRKQWPFLGKREYAYRIVAYAMKGWPPKGGRTEVVRHLCGNKYCVHPGHLAVGTSRENTLDEVRAQAGNLGATDDTLPPISKNSSKPSVHKRVLTYKEVAPETQMRTPSGRKPKRRR